MTPHSAHVNKAESSSPHIRCADCAHCRQYREVDQATGRYVLKVRCSKGHWRRGRKRGALDLYRVMSRRMQKCMDYDSMSESDEDRRQYLRALSATLPLERIVYEADGEPADIFEVHSIRNGLG